MLVSFLVRYPELSTLKFDPKERVLSFTIFMMQGVPQEVREQFLKTLGAHWEAARMVDPTFSPLGKVSFADLEEITALVYEQSVERVNVPEVRLFMQLVGESFRGQLSDETLSMQEEDLETQEEIIGMILGKKKELAEEKVIVAYRDGGRVFVYNP